MVRYRHAQPFSPAGQSTQMIIGATPESDWQILRLTQGLYRKYRLKRVFFSAYVPVNTTALLPPAGTRPPLLREHRLYQADWLLRYYGFTAEELLDEAHPNFNPLIDPKANWALHHMEQFPVEVTGRTMRCLLRVPGIGVKSARAILRARRAASLDFPDLKKLGVVLKRASISSPAGEKPWRDCMCLRMPFCGISSPSKAGTCCLRNPSSSFPFLKALPKHGETYSKKQSYSLAKVTTRGLREWFTPCYKRGLRPGRYLHATDMPHPERQRRIPGLELDAVFLRFPSRGNRNHRG